MLVARISPAVPEAPVPTPKEASCVFTFVAAAVIVISAEPLKLTPFIVRAVCRVVAVVALPDNAPETVGTLNTFVPGL